VEHDPLKNLYGREFPAGTVIFREGDPGSNFYIIQTGRVRIVKAMGTSHEVTLTELHDGEFFGEMALFELETRSATAIATTLTTVYDLEQRNLESFLLHKPRIAYFIIQRLCQRIRRMNDRWLEEQPRPKDEVEHLNDVAAALLLLLAGNAGTEEAGQVVVSAIADLPHLADLYGCDMAQLADALSSLGSGPVATGLLARHPALPADTREWVAQLLARTLIRIRVRDGRKEEGES
jgi:CRP-like cAMP-binding protein